MAGRITSYQRNGLTFEVADEGPLDGEVIVLLHGFPQLNTVWQGITPALHAAGYRTIAPNQRGYSPGARPKGRRPYRITELVGDIVTLADVVGTPVHLVAHDWGAAAAWVAVARHPERFRSYVAVSVPHPGSYLRAMPRGQFLRSWYMGVFNVPWLADRLLTHRRLAERALRAFDIPPEAFERFWRDFGEDRARLRGGLAWYRALTLEDPRGVSAPSRVPSTLVWSDGDSAISRASVDSCLDFVDAPYRLEIMRGSHWIPDEKPEELTRIILERVNSSQA